MLNFQSRYLAWIEDDSAEAIGNPIINRYNQVVYPLTFEIP